MAKRKAKQSSTTPRMTISVSTSLRERILAVTEEVNWSAVASMAFESKLAEIAARKEKQDMDAVIQKFRAQENEEIEKDWAEAAALGEDWAKDPKGATRKQLKRLEKLIDNCGNDWGRMFSPDAYGPDEWLHQSIEGLEEADRKDAEIFWEEILGTGKYQDMVNEPELFRAFAEGAVAVWYQVKQHL